MAIPKSFSPRPEEKELLTFDEFEQVKKCFIAVFDWSMETFVVEGDVIEIAKHVSDFYILFRLHQVVLPEVVDNYNSRIFMIPLIRDFHLELLERFSMEIASINPRAFQGVINTLAIGASNCKAQTVEKRVDGLAPSLISINRSFEDVVQVYLDNPWLVTLTLLTTQFKRTALGKAPIKDLTEPKRS